MSEFSEYRSITMAELDTRGWVAADMTINKIVAKALDGQRYLLLLCEFMWVYGGERGTGPEGANDLCFVGFEALGIYNGICAMML